MGEEGDETAAPLVSCGEWRQARVALPRRCTLLTATRRVVCVGRRFGLFIGRPLPKPFDECSFGARLALERASRSAVSNASVAGVGILLGGQGQGLGPLES